MLALNHIQASKQRQAFATHAFQKVDFKLETLKQEKKKVAQVDGKKVLLVESQGKVYAVSNKCSHLGLPLQGRTAIAQAAIEDGASPCVTCSFHGTKFSLESGEVQGEWCPKMINLPIVGKVELTGEKPLPTFQVKVEEDGSILVDAS